MVKALISWTVSMLLAFQPTAWAVTKEDSLSIKKFLEVSEMTQKQVTAKELYNKLQSGLPEDFRKEFKTFVDQNPNYKFPKISVTKATGPKGEEDIQLQFVHNKEAAIMTITGRDGVFAKIGKETITFADLADSDRAFEKFEKAIPPKGVQASNPRNPSSIPNKSPVFLKSKDILKLDKADQKKYFKNFRDLLESMEEVQNKVPARKTSAVEKSEIDLFVSLFVSEAHAQDQSGQAGTTCIVGGWVSNFQKDPRTNKLSCGHNDATISQGCSSNQTRCNPVVYGDGRAPSAICVQTGYTVTQLCNQYVQTNKIDIPDISKSAAELDQLTERAKAQAAQLKEVCDASYGSQAGTSASFKNKFKDQVSTCSEFERRIAEINRWPCSNPEFKSNSNYQRLCEAATPPVGQLPPVVVTPDGPGQIAPVDPTMTCDPQYHIWDGNKKNCHKSQGYLSSTCVINGEDISVRSCTCDGTPEVIGKACPGGEAGVDDGRPERKKPGWFKRNSKTLLYFAAGLAGLLVGHWAYKTYIKESYPKFPEAKDPVPVPTPAPPVTLPPPRPGVI